MDEWFEGWRRVVGMTSGWVAGVQKAQAATIEAATRQMALMTELYGRVWGTGPRPEGTPPAAGEDARFHADAWRENVAFDVLWQTYVITARWLVDLADGLEGIHPEIHKRVRFWAQQYADAMSPSNFAATNPEVLEEVMRTGGENLMRGLHNFLSDLEQGQISMVPEGSFEVGVDLAATPGKVVHRNPLIELIQYTPATETVHEVPVLAIPPWINKYYVMDLSPHNSMYRYLVEQGFTLFTISWKNPDETTLDLEWADYMEMGVIEALRVVRAITGAEQVSTLGYCLGGIIEQVTLAYLAGRDPELNRTEGIPEIKGATYFATHQDFTDAGDVDVFISEPQVRMLEWLMESSGGYLDGRNMGATFSLLRANDLLWHYVVHNYLLGKQPPAFDLLYWNSDGTRVPGRVHSFLLREMFLGNKLRQPDAIEVRGVGIDTRRITAPAYVVAANGDHIVPWRGAFTMREIAGGPVRFVLAESGHIAGIINPPAANKRRYWAHKAGEEVEDPDRWLVGADEHPGSWWPDWVAWLAERSGGRVAPPAMGSEEYPAVGDAPGTYVLE
jgi:polyhydroxyalkanoate synthase subunit PhaC